MNPHDYPHIAASVTRVKASHPRDIDLPIDLEPTLVERFAMSWLTPFLFVAVRFLCAAVIVFVVR